MGGRVAEKWEEVFLEFEMCEGRRRVLFLYLPARSIWTSPGGTLLEFVSFPSRFGPMDPVSHWGKEMRASLEREHLNCPGRSLESEKLAAYDK
jgi:hypothetical protein